jgi:benzil reductase ((S)-benzoin forming)
MSTPMAPRDALRQAEQLALVTGGSRGLGHALCEELRGQGYTVLALSRTASGPDVCAVDLEDSTQSAATVRELLCGFDLSRVRDFIFMNNAATLEPIGLVANAPETSLLRNLHVNLVSAVAVISGVLALLETSTSRKVLVNVSSGAAQKAHAGLAGYCAAKAGMEHFIRCVAVEHASHSHPMLAINVDPGAMDTDMQARLRAAEKADYPGRDAFVARHSQGQLASPATVAAAIVQIARSDGLVPGARYRVHDHV